VILVAAVAIVFALLLLEGFTAWIAAVVIWMLMLIWLHNRDF
jgi:hypothetical protein